MKKQIHVVYIDVDDVYKVKSFDKDEDAVQFIHERDVLAVFEGIRLLIGDKLMCYPSGE